MHLDRFAINRKIDQAINTTIRLFAGFLHEPSHNSLSKPQAQLLHLPDHVLDQILSYLSDYRDKFAVLRVCRRLNACGRRKAVWMNLRQITVSYS